MAGIFSLGKSFGLLEGFEGWDLGGRSQGWSELVIFC